MTDLSTNLETKLERAARGLRAARDYTPRQHKDHDFIFGELVPDGLVALEELRDDLTPVIPKGYYSIKITDRDGRAVYTSPGIIPGASSIGYMPPGSRPEYEIKITWNEALR
jgi:hypothetical protein